jgi:2-ketocyclohexanecarboxyl-CoA hydrolase
MGFQDIIYDSQDGILTITINRPEVMNALRKNTVKELIEAFTAAAVDRTIGVVILTGAGPRAFCAGGDLKEDDGHAGDLPPEPMRALEMTNSLRAIPKPVIAAANGWALGAGFTLQLLCDLTIASETARWNTGALRVGSADPGYGTILLARAVGDKRAREMWYLGRDYTASEALAMGLVNKVVPPEELMAEATAWAKEMLAVSPTGLKLTKLSFQMDAGQAGATTALGYFGLDLFEGSAESQEAMDAFSAKRVPDYSSFRR